jgi:hypothetical protein
MKMLTSAWVHISAGASVAVIGIVLFTAIAVSVWLGPRTAQQPGPDGPVVWIFHSHLAFKGVEHQ